MGRNISIPDPEVGTTYSEWTVTGASASVNGARMIPVMCSCGTTGIRLRSNLVSGKSKSCGCTSRVAKPSVGDAVGEWTVLEYLNPHHVLVRCSCGQVYERYVYTIGSDSVSCGHPVPQGYLTKHGVSGRARGNHGRERSKLRIVRRLMLQRCGDPTDTGYVLYGGRGIHVCPAWASSEDAFVSWALSAGYRVGQRLTIDRINTDGPYAPENCRWVTAKENGRNRRNTRFLTAWGETKALGAWLEDPRCVVSYSTLWSRIRKGTRTPEDIVSSPVHVAPSTN